MSDTRLDCIVCGCGAQPIYGSVGEVACATCGAAYWQGREVGEYDLKPESAKKALCDAEASGFARAKQAAARVAREHGAGHESESISANEFIRRHGTDDLPAAILNLEDKP